MKDITSNTVRKVQRGLDDWKARGGEARDYGLRRHDQMVYCDGFGPGMSAQTFVFFSRLEGLAKKSRLLMDSKLQSAIDGDDCAGDPTRAV
jgi:hypothetical protein